MQPFVRQGISACRNTGRTAVKTAGQAPIPAAIFLCCCLMAVLFTAAHFSAAVASVSDSSDAVVTAVPQALVQPANISDLLQKLLNPNPQTRAAASQSLGTISPEIKIPALVQSLSDSNWKIQVLAAYNLGQMGPTAREAIPALATALETANPDVRFVITKALGKIGSEAAVSALARALQDKDENVRMAAAIGLDSLGPDAQAALPVLQKSLRDGNWFVRTHAAKAFVRLAANSAEMLPRLLENLNAVTYQNKRPIPVEIAIDTLVEMGPVTVPPLLQSITYSDFNNQPRCSFPTIALVILASKAEPSRIVNQLVPDLHSPQTAVRNHAAMALGWVGAKAAIPPLLDAPLDKEKFTALQRIGRRLIHGKTDNSEKSAPEDVRTLAAALQHRDWQLRASALPVLASLDESYLSPEAKIPYFAGALEDRDWRVRMTAAAALGSDRSFAEGVSLFMTALNDSDVRVRQSALEALANSHYKNDPKILQALELLQDNLLVLLQDKNQSIRLAALEFIIPSDRTRPALLNLLQDRNLEIRLAVCEKFVKVGAGPQFAENFLIHVLKHHHDAKWRRQAILALRPSSSASTVSAKIQALQDRAKEIRVFAAESLGRAGQMAATAIINAVQDEAYEVRRAAISSLQKIGSPAAVPAIIAALDDDDEGVRFRAKNYFSSIKPDSRRREVLLLASQEIGRDLHHDDWQVRRAAAEKLGLIDSFPSSISDPPLPTLLAALQDQHPNVCASAAPALADIYSQVVWKNQHRGSNETLKLAQDLALACRQALPLLLESLKNGDAPARFGAIYTFGKFGPVAQATIPVLRDTLNDENWLIRYWAAVALTQIDPRETSGLPVIAEIFRDPELVELLEKKVYPEGNRDDLKALSNIGSSQAISVLVDYLCINDEKFRLSQKGTLYGKYAHPQSTTADILVKTGPRVIPALITALKNNQGRFLVADTLGLMGPDAIAPLKLLLQPPAQEEPALGEILRDKDADLRRSAVYALGKIGMKKPQYRNSITDVLHQVMSDPAEPDGVRWMAAAALREMGTPVDRLFEARTFPNPEPDNCIHFEIYGFFNQFDLYEARCILADRGGGASGPELYQLVRKLLTKTPGPDLQRPSPQPTAGE